MPKYSSSRSLLTSFDLFKCIIRGSYWTSSVFRDVVVKCNPPRNKQHDLLKLRLITNFISCFNYMI